MKKELAALVIIAFFSTTLHGLCADGAAPTISIQPLSGDAADVPDWQPAIGSGISEMILESLEKSAPNIQVADTSANGARSAKADYILSGDVTEFMTDTNLGSVTGFFAKIHLASKNYDAHVAIAWRLTRTSSQQIIRRGSAMGSGSGPLYVMPGTAASQPAAPKKKAKKKKDSSDDSSDSSTASDSQPAAAKSDTTLNIGYSNLEFMGTGLGMATDATVSNLVAQLTVMTFNSDGSAFTRSSPLTGAAAQATGKVLAAPSKDAVIVSLGSSEGFKSGDELGVYQSTQVKDGKGNVVYNDETLVGTITLESVQADRSRGSFSGSGTVQEGLTVKANDDFIVRFHPAAAILLTGLMAAFC